MWQRIQTLYLFLSTVLVALLFFCNKSQGVSFISYFPYLILIVVITVLHLIALTTWRFRIFQMRTAMLAAIITVALQVWLIVDFLAIHKDTGFYITAMFPFAAIVFDALAARSIFADELIVRSASRLRGARRGDRSGKKSALKPGKAQKK